MSEHLPAPEFDPQHYERPNQNWICGHSAEGQRCRSGPDGRGRCRAASECAPVLETKAGETKGRWRCTRPGGPCETGPRPDGACGRPISRCSPRPTLRTQRGRLTLAVVIATVAFLLVVLGSPLLRTRFINPGQLSTPHSSDAFANLAAGIPSPLRGERARVRGSPVVQTGENTQNGTLTPALSHRMGEGGAMLAYSATNRAELTCGACHKAGAFGPSGLAAAAFHASPGPLDIVKLAKVRPAEMTAIDESCQKCHPNHLAHQPNVVRELSCSFCHAEHRGGGPMSAPTEANCTFCHGDADSMTAAASRGTGLPPEAFHSRVAPGHNAFPMARPAAGFTQIIHRFAGDHPEFRVHADKLRDPDALKFGHALHLTSQTIPNLPNGDKLSCAFCHQPDAAGAYYRNTKFEAHCRVCHSLQFDPETPGLTLPHGEPGLASAFLHSLPRQYADYAERSGITGADEQKLFVQQRLQRLQALVLSGEDFEKRAFFSTSVAGPAAQVGTVSGATRALYPGCTYCHEVKSNAQGGPEITKPVMFDRWLSHGGFNHAKHSKMVCAQCHQAERSKVTADIILPSKETCAVCHSASGGVADSCTTCHSYH